MRRVSFLRLSLAATVVLAPACAEAWPLWIVPSVWRPEAPGALTFQIYSKVDSGESSAPLTREDLESAVAIDALGRRDLMTKLPPGTLLPLQIRATGTTVIAVHTKPVIQKLAAAEFAAFLKANFPAMAASRAGHENEEAFLTTSYFSKSIIQVGGKVTPNYFKPVGHSLELMPVENPFDDQGKASSLHARAFDKGVSASKTRVVASDLYGNNIWGPAHPVRVTGPNETGEDGWYLFPGTGGAVFRVMQLDPAGDGVHYTLRTATLAIRRASTGL